MGNEVLLSFSHTDLDGVAGTILHLDYANRKGISCDWTSCNYDNVDKKIQDKVFEFSKKNFSCIHAVFINDIGVSEETALLLDRLHNEFGIPVVLKDHHDSAEWLNRYEWAFVQSSDRLGYWRCGSYWTALELGLYEKWKPFVDSVNSWDCWTWKSSPDLRGWDLNALLQVKGREAFIGEMYSKFSNEDCISTVDSLFDIDDKIVIQSFNQMNEKECKHALFSMKVVPIQIEGKFLYAGVIFTSWNPSYVGDYVFDNMDYPDDIDFLMIFNLPSYVSLRSQRDLDPHLYEIAKCLTGDGGGHEQSAGAQIRSELSEKIINSILNVIHPANIESFH